MNKKNLIGKKFKRNVYGLSSWTDTIVSVTPYYSYVVGKPMELKHIIMGKTNIAFDLEELIIF